MYSEETSPMDRRVDARLDVRLPCHVAFPESKSRLFVGVTENMSRSGILVIWNRNGPHLRIPRPGELLTAEIELPPSHAFGRKCMHCQVRVVRVSAPDTGIARVAFQIEQMQFRSYAEGRFARGEVPGELSHLLM